MTIKKMLLLAVTAMAVMAFTAPMAHALEWYSDPGEVKLGGEGAAASFAGEGELSSTTNGFTTGPAKVEVEGKLWNQNGMGHGVVEEFVILGANPVNPLPPALDCTATAVANNLPWTITTTAEIVDITGVSFTNFFNHACQTLGFPANATATGTATGTFNNKTSSLVFTNAGDLKVGEAATTLNGSVAIVGEEGGFTGK